MLALSPSASPAPGGRCRASERKPAANRNEKPVAGNPNLSVAGTFGHEVGQAFFE